MYKVLPAAGQWVSDTLTGQTLTSDGNKDQTSDLSVNEQSVQPARPVRSQSV